STGRACCGGPSRLGAGRAGLAARNARSFESEGERGESDAVLLDRVRGRVSLGRTRAPRPPDVADGDAGGGLLEPVPDTAPRAHVLRFLLRPDDLAEARV